MTRPFHHAEVSRRALLAGMAGSAAFLAMPSSVLAQVAPANPTFRHGVASGDPDATSIVLWTRVTAEGPVEGTWELSATPDFAKVLKTGPFKTDADRDHTVKVLAEGLAPGGMYYYRFRMGDAVSPLGRARTLPDGRLDRLGIALASCSNYAFGYFNAYDAIARDADVDFVLHTGDYIYEYGGKDGWGADIAQKIGRVQAPLHEIVSLTDYRTRHAQYKTDAGAQAMHANHSLLACWDDHESANNPWTGGAQNHQPDTEGDWATRRAASIRAYFEWMPVREPEWLKARGRTRMQFWRGYSFGDLATLHTIETRHTARAKQIEYVDYAETITDAASAERFKKEVLGAPNRPILSAECEADLSAALSRSVEQGQPWRIIGCPMVIGRVEVPDVVKLGVVPDPSARLAAAKSREELAKLSADPAVAIAWKGKYNLPDYTDAWGGYPWARERLYDLSRKAGAGDLVFLSGDSHSFWANRLADDAGRSAGIEFGTAGISSPGDFVDSGFGDTTARALDKVYAEHIPEVTWTDNMHQGYVRVEFTREQGVATFVAVDTVLTPDYRTMVLRRVPFARQGKEVAFT
ncbi:alkaline phosphatase D family protein [Novosphingobium mangrovi (ex Huang et al. 2023)]|uniref:Alkaline phosphatase D family protein n=1 Tax=Novosphingobium mangrovi (ex Huang et al. 2023) TaxID=2976432 RepID=A0ABT2I9R8_9SPHN|nr:alkaline phosphatase D family protein [Novosphingobium mangrovi (ex Huang et al. 2023)]MCT2401553.1 alkaline phosphatase D family protein [Novosphingobium mangrovi (ex Huang et al. 2023)]